MNRDFDVNKYFDTMKDVAGIPIEKSWVPEIKFHLTTAEKMAAIIASAPIDEDTIDLSSDLATESPHV